MTPEQAKKLRDPFPASAVGKLPKGGVQLDYVGHAAVTDRLLQVDPSWTWEPLALSPEGLPALDRAGNLWIKLTVCGVTRLGVGDGKTAKECIGDAIRNAAMRFGVALDLWAKEDLHGDGDEPAKGSRGTDGTQKRATGGASPQKGGGHPPDPPPAPAPVPNAVLLTRLLELGKKWKELKPEWDENELQSWLTKKPRSQGELEAAIATYTENIAAVTSPFQIPSDPKGKAA